VRTIGGEAELTSNLPNVALQGSGLRRIKSIYARLGPRGYQATMSAVAARGTVEMLSAPERVKVSTDVPSQPCSPLADPMAGIPSHQGL
jgi:hypothetical protein